MEQVATAESVEAIELAEVPVAEVAVEAAEAVDAPPLEALRAENVSKVACAIGKTSCVSCEAVIGCPFARIPRDVEPPATEKSPREQLFDESIDFVQPTQSAAEVAASPTPQSTEPIITPQVDVRPLPTPIIETPQATVPTPIETLQTAASTIAEPQLSPAAIIETVRQTVAAAPELDTPSFQPTDSDSSSETTTQAISNEQAAIPSVVELSGDAPGETIVHKPAPDEPSDESAPIESNPVNIMNGAEYTLPPHEPAIASSPETEFVDSIEAPETIGVVGESVAPISDITPTADIPKELPRVSESIDEPIADLSAYPLEDIEPVQMSTEQESTILPETINNTEPITLNELPALDDAPIVEISQDSVAETIIAETVVMDAPANVEVVEPNITEESTPEPESRIDEEPACPYQWVEEDADQDETAPASVPLQQETNPRDDLPESQFAAYIDREQEAENEPVEIQEPDDVYSIEDLGDPEDVSVTPSHSTKQDATPQRVLGRIAYTLAA